MGKMSRHAEQSLNLMGNAKESRAVANRESELLKKKTTDNFCTKRAPCKMSWTPLLFQF